MKKISVIACIAFLLAAVFNSCKVEDHSVTQLNKNGMALTSYWQAATQRVMINTPNTVFHFNAWLSASEEDQPAIEDKYFTYSKLRQISDNEWMIITNGKNRCRINTGGKLLSDPGAEWSVVDYDQSYLLMDMLPFGKDSVKMAVTHSGNRWTVMTFEEEGSAVASPEYTPFFGFNITSGTIPADLNDCPCVVEGSGRYAVRTYQYTDTNEPTEIHNYLEFNFLGGNTNDCFYWANGSLTMRIYADANAHAVNATNRELYDEIIIRDKLSLRSGSQYAEITMHDVTETWPVERLQEYGHFECGNFFAALFELF